MSPRQKRLPLNDRRWLSVATAHSSICRSPGDFYVVAEDMTDALADGRLRSMRRQINGDGPNRELLSSSFWAEHKIESWDRENLTVVRRGEGALTIYGVFYVWEPDYEKVFRGGANPRRAQVAPTPKAPEGAKKQGAPLKHDWVAITTEVAFREATATKRQRDKSDLAEARSVRRWCATRLKQRPALSDIREIVKAVRERFRQPD
jgi:hypothetical protein